MDQNVKSAEINVFSVLFRGLKFIFFNLHIFGVLAVSFFVILVILSLYTKSELLFVIFMICFSLVSTSFVMTYAYNKMSKNAISFISLLKLSIERIPSLLGTAIILTLIAGFMILLFYGASFVLMLIAKPLFFIALIALPFIYRIICTYILAIPLSVIEKNPEGGVLLRSKKLATGNRLAIGVLFFLYSLSNKLVENSLGEHENLLFVIFMLTYLVFTIFLYQVVNVILYMELSEMKDIPKDSELQI